MEAQQLEANGSKSLLYNLSLNVWHSCTLCSLSQTGHILFEALPGVDGWDEGISLSVALDTKLTFIFDFGCLLHLNCGVCLQGSLPNTGLFMTRTFLSTKAEISSMVTSLALTFIMSLAASRHPS